MSVTYNVHGVRKGCSTILPVVFSNPVYYNACKVKDFLSKGCPRGSVILVFCHVIYSHHVNCIEKLNRKAFKNELKRNTRYSSSVKHVRNGSLIVSLGQ